jgi:tRNA(Arg) A34 adenosine deaminase TadA
MVKEQVIRPVLQLKNIILPAWVTDEVYIGQALESEADRMGVAIRLSCRQVAEGTGGPFGAVVCELETGRVIGIGINQVTNSSWSGAHAEFIAWTMAQETMNSYDLGSGNSVGLYSSAQPCVSCWGGVFWTGISRLVYAATKCDVEQYAGFDEGPLPNDWKESLITRGVSVQGEMLREKAVVALKEYGRLGGERYNASNLETKC